jgi:hypothetical protein
MPVTRDADAILRRFRRSCKPFVGAAGKAWAEPTKKAGIAASLFLLPLLGSNQGPHD